VFPVNQKLYRDIRNLGGPIQFQIASQRIPGGSGLAPTGLLKDRDKAIERLCDVPRGCAIRPTGALLTSEPHLSWGARNGARRVAQKDAGYTGRRAVRFSYRTQGGRRYTLIDGY
jgi:hypothetical protein